MIITFQRSKWGCHTVSTTVTLTGKFSVNYELSRRNSSRSMTAAVDMSAWRATVRNVWKHFQLHWAAHCGQAVRKQTGRHATQRRRWTRSTCCLLGLMNCGESEPEQRKASSEFTGSHFMYTSPLWWQGCRVVSRGGGWWKTDDKWKHDMRLEHCRGSSIESFSDIHSLVLLTCTNRTILWIYLTT